jgi:hypothetical protein
LNGDFIQRIIDYLKSIKLNQNILVFGFFLLISSFFWFLNALNKEYYADITVPVTYNKLPENKLVAGPLAKKLNVKITAFGHEVMNYKTSSINSAEIDLSKHSLHLIPGGEEKRYYILTSTIKEDVAHVLGPDVEIKKIEPDSLIFTLEDVVTKKVPVVSHMQIEFEKQFMMKKKVFLKPDSVTIKGVKSSLDTISFIATDSVKLEGVEDSVNIMVELATIPGTEITPQMVNCLVPVEKFTELNFELPIGVVNVPKGYSVKLFPASAKVTCNVGFSKYQSIFKEQFSLVADLAGFKEAVNSRLRIKLVRKPEHISNVRIHPQAIDYIIEKND